ncbi:MAG: DUF58 domain-containing protein [Cytophagales bacterium]
MKEILKKVRKLELKIRRRVNNTFAGEYHTAFKGQGLEFDEVRQYQYGDEIRTIDWNVTARSNGVFVKKFKEERERTLFVLFDISGSEDFGNEQENKLMIGTEIASILAFSALKNNDKIGMATFSDQIEQFYAPQKGKKHVLAIIRSLLTHTAHSKGTNLALALDFIRKTQKRKSILLIISDFLAEDYTKSLINLSRKHEVILIRLFNPREVLTQGFGTVPTIDLETGEIAWIHAGNSQHQQQLSLHFEQIEKNLTHLSHKYEVGYISVNTQIDYFPVLEGYFKRRIAQIKRRS